MAYIYRNGRRWRAQIDRLGVRLSETFDLCRVMGWRNPKQAMVYYNLSAEDIAKKIDDPVDN